MKILVVTCPENTALPVRRKAGKGYGQISMQTSKKYEMNTMTWIQQKERAVPDRGFFGGRGIPSERSMQNLVQS